MNRMGATVAITWLAGLAVFAVPVSAGQVAEAPAVQVETVERHYGYPVLRVFEGYTLKAGDTAREITVVFGDAHRGHVDRDVIVILGSAHLKSTAVIYDRWWWPVDTCRRPRAPGPRGSFVGGGGLDAPAGFGPGGHYVGVGSSTFDGYFRDLVPG